MQHLTVEYILCVFEHPNDRIHHSTVPLVINQNLSILCYRPKLLCGLFLTISAQYISLSLNLMTIFSLRLVYHFYVKRPQLSSYPMRLNEMIAALSLKPFVQFSAFLHDFPLIHMYYNHKKVWCLEYNKDLWLLYYIEKRDVNRFDRT